MASKCILKDISDEIRVAGVFAIMADEVTSHNQEVMAICARFVDQDCQVREEFLGFCNVDRITGVVLANEIKKVLQDNNIDIECLRGQCYDGAANMSGKTSGVQAIIKRAAPKALYTHCSSHCLNLVIAHSCKLLCIRNAIDKMQSVIAFFLMSPKRNKLLEGVASASIKHEKTRKAILDACKTRWAMRHKTYQRFHNSFTAIVETLEVIAFGSHADKYDVVRGFLDWDGKSKHEASGLLSGITDFSFIVAFNVVFKLLSHLEAITVQLQSSTLDVLAAYSMVKLIFSKHSNMFIWLNCMYV